MSDLIQNQVILNNLIENIYWLQEAKEEKKVLVVVFTAIVINYLNLHQEHNNKFSQKEGTF
jgi:hypothetical protein